MSFNSDQFRALSEKVGSTSSAYHASVHKFQEAVDAGEPMTVLFTLSTECESCMTAFMEAKFDLDGLIQAGLDKHAVEINAAIERQMKRDHE